MSDPTAYKYGIADKSEAWDIAKNMVDPIIQQHGIADVKSGGPMFYYSPTTFTKVDQHISHILEVANWLLREDPDE